MAMTVYKIQTDVDIFSNASPGEFQSKFEAKNTLQTLDFLGKISPDIVNEFCFLILFNSGQDIRKWAVETFSHKKKIIIIFDEIGRTPEELLEESTNIVFHAYLNFATSEKKYPNLYHYPLGCNSFVPEMDYVLPSERTINVFYSGNLHIGRKKLYQELTHLHFLPFPILARFQNFFRLRFDERFPSSFIRFTNGFSKGFYSTEYASQLSNSKIILSPPGISNLECFRHYEGLRAGCVVIAERLPTKPQLTNSPIIEVKDWSKGFKIIKDLLNDPLELEALSKKSFSWYHDQLSPKPVARYIFETIKGFRN